MAKATGIFTPTATFQDRDSVLIGAVRATDDQAAETRTGAARLLSDNLRNTNYLKIVGRGVQSNASGGYFIEIHHVAPGGALPASNSTNWIRIGVLVFKGKDPRELGFTGLQLDQIVRDTHSPTLAGNVDVRLVAIRLVAGTGTGSGQNGLAVPPDSSGCTVFFQRN